MVPMVLVGAYFQALGEYEVRKEWLVEDQNAFVITRLERYVAIVFLYSIGHYLTQIEYTTLIIEKQMILKQ